MLALKIAEEPGGDRCGRVLHPPFAVRIAFEINDRALVICKPDAPGRQHDAAEPLRPAFRIGLHCQIDRRRGKMRFGNHQRSVGPVNGREPTLEPVGQGRNRRPNLRQKPLLLGGQPPQKRIHEAGKPLVARIVIRLFDGEINGSAVRHVKIKDLGRRDCENMLKRPRTVRQRRLEQRPDHRLNAGQMAQRRIQDRPYQASVCRRERHIGRVAASLVEHAIERGFLVDDSGQQPRGGLACGEPGFI